MSLGELQGKYGDFYVPRFEVTVGGETVRESDGVISDLSVEATTDRADEFSFSLHYPFDPGAGAMNTGTFVGFDRERFGPGADVEISLGYGDALERVLRGKITAVSTDFPAGGTPTIDVRGHDLLDDMMRGTKSRSWPKTTGDEDPPPTTTDGAVAEEVAAEYFGPGNVEVAETDLEREEVNQDRESDYRFLTRLAERNRFELSIRRGTLYFGPPRDGPPDEGSPAVTLRYGSSLAAFSFERNNAGQVAEVQVHGWDPVGAEKIVGSATQEGPGTGTTILRRPVRSQEEADRLARAELDRIAGRLDRANGETVGLPEVWAGETVRLEGVGPHSDDYYVESATHRIGESGYTTSFRVRPADAAKGTRSDAEPGLGGRGPEGRLRGVAVGTVAENAGDPENLGRVRVTFPWRGADDRSYWARVAAPMAGDRVGAYFLPDVDDEVLVAFDDGAVGHPYVLGGLWNGKRRPPETNDEETNDVRLLRSRSGHEIVLDDAEDAGRVAVTTNGGRAIVLDDADDGATLSIADGDGNEIVLDADGGDLDVTSGATLRLSADAIEIGSSGNVTIDATGNVDVKGRTINLNGP